MQGSVTYGNGKVQRSLATAEQSRVSQRQCTVGCRGATAEQRSAGQGNGKVLQRDEWQRQGRVWYRNGKVQTNGNGTAEFCLATAECSHAAAWQSRVLCGNGKVGSSMATAKSSAVQHCHGRVW